jgi:glycogen operon protein
VDGFRFDLGTILAREPNGFDGQSGFLKACSQDPVLDKVKMIAEPWDCGPGGYQVGGFPPGWAEWNDTFRDTVRDFWRGSAPASDLTRRLCASADVFNRHGRKPWASVNFITAHDGFTLNDLVSYNDKHNEANGENNQDGTSDNRSWNCGVEGPTDDPAVNALRARQMRNMLATLLLAHGTPMLLAGDEFARTQQGNNNAYCQDNAIGWVDWNIGPKGEALIQFVRALTAIRREYPIFRRSRFLTGARNEALGIKDVTWLHVSGEEMRDEQWADQSMRGFGMLMDGRAQPTGIPRPGEDATALVVLNAFHEPLAFTLPEWAGGSHWTKRLDTNAADGEGGPARAEFGVAREVAARSLQLFILESS